MTTSIFFTILCFLSTFFIIQLAPPFYGLPIFGRTRITVQVGLIAVILAIILRLCGAQCISINHWQVRQGIGPYADYYVPLRLTQCSDDILVLFISQGFMAVVYGGMKARKICVSFYYLPIAIAAVFLPQTPPLSMPTQATRRTSKRKSKTRSRRNQKSATVEDSGASGGEKFLSDSLILTTLSLQLLAKAPSLIIFDTILGILFSLPF